jgi:hypothetical protein
MMKTKQFLGSEDRWDGDWDSDMEEDELDD